MSRMLAAARISAAAALVAATLIGGSASSATATTGFSVGCAALNADPTTAGTTGNFTATEVLVLTVTSGSNAIVFDGQTTFFGPIPSTGEHTVAVNSTTGSWAWTCLPASADVSGRVLVNGVSYTGGTNAVTLRVGDPFYAGIGMNNAGPGGAVNWPSGVAGTGSAPPVACGPQGPSGVGGYLRPGQFSGWFDVLPGSGCSLTTAGEYTFGIAASSDTPDPDVTNNAASVTVTVLPQFTFTGFYQPVDSAPSLNVMKAGAAVPVKFSLGGDRGLSIFAAGFPASVPVTCGATAPTDSVEQTVAAGLSTLSYDALTDTYSYVWKTDKAWKGTCRQLTVKFVDGTTRTALFKLS